MGLGNASPSATMSATWPRQRLLRAQERVFQSFPCAYTAREIREADAEIAIGVLIDKGWVIDFPHFNLFRSLCSRPASNPLSFKSAAMI